MGRTPRGGGQAVEFNQCLPPLSALPNAERGVFSSYLQPRSFPLSALFEVFTHFPSKCRHDIRREFEKWTELQGSERGVAYTVCPASPKLPRTRSSTFYPLFERFSHFEEKRGRGKKGKDKNTLSVFPHPDRLANATRHRRARAGRPLRRCSGARFLRPAGRPQRPGPCVAAGGEAPPGPARGQTIGSETETTRLPELSSDGPRQRRLGRGLTPRASTPRSWRGSGKHRTFLEPYPHEAPAVRRWGRTVASARGGGERASGSGWMRRSRWRVRARAAPGVRAVAPADGPSPARRYGGRLGSCGARASLGGSSSIPPPSVSPPRYPPRVRARGGGPRVAPPRDALGYLVDPASSICLSQRLSHASVSTCRQMAKPRTAH